MALIGVIGAGVMGADVALNCAAFGHSVVLKDIDAAALQAAKEGIPQKLRSYRMMGATAPSWNAGEIAQRVRFTLDYDALAQADWIIENVVEDWDVKSAEYRRLRECCRPDAYFAVNTSCISVTRIAALMPHPERVLGTHFMNPVPLKRAVEVIQAHRTSDETLEAAKSFLHSIGKSAIVVKDFPGFVSNRLSHLFMNEAAFLVQDGVAKPPEIDAIFREGYGHKMGPLETADLIGLDTVVASLDVLYRNYQDTKFRCCPRLRQMVDAGDLGRKSGRGFYDYRR